MQALTVNPNPTASGCLSTADAAAPLPRLLGPTKAELLLFGGKGGAGKTTCAAATALHLAMQSPEEAFLLVSIDPAHSVMDSFAGDPPPPNLSLVEIDARRRLDAFKAAHARHLRQIALRGTFLDDDDVSRLLDLSLPGLDEVIAFDEIASVLGDGLYACVIVDTAPTGHTLRFLELPAVLDKWVGALDAMLAKHRYMAKRYGGRRPKEEAEVFLERLGQRIKHLSAVLGDPVRCLFVPVLRAEPLGVSETVRLVNRLGSMRIRVTDILVNRLYPSDEACPACRDVARQQHLAIRRLRQELPTHTIWQIPLHGAEVRGVDNLDRFWQGVRPAEDAAEPRPAPPRDPRVECPAPLPGADVALLLFAGKGGVGKTTLATATAFRLAEAHPDRHVHLISTDPAHSLSDCLGSPVSRTGTQVGPRLTATEIDAEAEFEVLRQLYAAEVEEFFDRLLGGQQTVDLEFERDVLGRLLDLSPPGLDELMAVARIVSLLEASGPGTLVLDTAPTGHLVRLLELPGLIQEWLQVMFGLFLKYRTVFRLPRVSGFLVRLAKKIHRLRALLADPKKGQLIAVSIPAEMALEETRDLIAFCREAGIHVPTLMLNMLTARSPCALCSSLAAAEGVVRGRFGGAFRPMHQCLVYRGGEMQGPERLAQLGRALYVT